MAATLASGFMLLALAFSISLASPPPKIADPPRPPAAGASVPEQIQASTQVQATTSEPVKPALTWTGKSREDITQRRLSGHSEFDLQLD